MSKSKSKSKTKRTNDPKPRDPSPSERRFQKSLTGLRATRKWSQRTLGEKAGITVSYVSMLEYGRRSPPLSTLDAIAKAFQVTASSLIEGT